MITEQSLLVSTCISPLKNLDWSLPHAHLVASLTGHQTEVVLDAAPESRDVKQTVARHEERSPVAVRPASTGWVPQLTIRWNLYSDIYACLVITSRRCLQTRATQCTACRPPRAAPCWTGCLQTRAAPCFTGCLQTRAAPCCTDVCKPEPSLALQDVGEPDPLLAAQDVCNQQRRSLPGIPSNQSLPSHKMFTNHMSCPCTVTSVHQQRRLYQVGVWSSLLHSSQDDSPVATMPS